MSVGARPGANEALGVGFVPPDDPAARLSVGFVTQERRRADTQGRFRIDHAIPGPAAVRRLIVREFAGGVGSMSVAGWRTPSEVRSVATSTITVGGQGRAVAGEVVAGPGFPGPIDLGETIAMVVTPGPLDVPEVYGRDGRFRGDDLSGAVDPLRLRRSAEGRRSATLDAPRARLQGSARRTRGPAG